ncbi:MAG: hypothetical protein CMB80_02375 [Flammeovirgaceae bacterium]|nr:hypothetical protein [Flammeovirgaceae bacterium]
MKFLICGLGHMGKIHRKYLEQLDIEWVYYDPLLGKHEPQNRLKDLREIAQHGVTHVIVSSVEEKHYENYCSIREAGFKGPILIEKPAVLQREDFNVFDDPLVSVGFVERHNPAVQVLKNNIDIGDVISVDFARCSVKNVSNQRVDSFTDVGIHDIDLFFHLFGENNSLEHYFSGFSNTYVLVLRKKENFIARFIWSNETSFKERKIIIRHKSYTLVADLIGQTVRKESSDSAGRIITETLYVEKSSAVLSQLVKFIKDDYTCSGRPSHSFYLELKEAM